MTKITSAAELLFLECRHAFRRLARQPAFAIVACLSLGLGIGANTAAFSVLYAVMLRNLPVENPDRLAVVMTQYGGTQFSMSYPAYTFLRDRTNGIDGLIVFRPQPFNVRLAGSTERVTGMLVSGNYFDVLGVPMAMGQPLTPADDLVPRSGGSRGLVGVISHRYWTTRLGGGASAIGTVLTVEGQPVTIVGVTPAGFTGTRIGTMPDVYVPMMFSPNLFDDRWLTNPRNNWARLIVRMQPGQSLTQTEAAMTLALQQFNREVLAPVAPSEEARTRFLGGRIVLRPGASGLLEMGSTVGPSLYGLMALVLLVLLMACVNVASLLLARADAYARATAIARALGASGGRLWLRQLIETSLVASGGLAAGLVLAMWMRELLVGLLPSGQRIDLTIDRNVLGLSTIVGVLTAIVLATITAWQSQRVSVTGALKGQDRVSRAWLRKGLVAGQLTLAVVIAMAAALFTATLDRLHAVDPGFDREHVLIASLSPGSEVRPREAAFRARLLDELRALPGVVAVATADHQPLSVGTFWNLQVPHDARGAKQADASIAFISPGYFNVMGIPLLRGRDFSAQDQADPMRAVIVNENFVARYAGGSDPIGLRFYGNGKMEFEVVGVVRDIAQTGLRDLDQQMIYVPRGGNVIHVRAAMDPATLAPAVEAAVRRLEPNVPIHDIRTIDQQIDRAMNRERTFAQLSSSFAAISLLLAALGLYGVIAHAVSQRRKEMAIRVALGANPSSIVGLVLRDAVTLVVAGLGLGIPAAIVVARTLQSLLYAIEPADPASLAMVVSTLVIVAVTSAWLPARRAARINPLIALKGE